MENKKKLRAFYKQKRMELSSEQIRLFSESITKQFCNSTFIQYTNFHVFLSIVEQKEVSTQSIIEFLMQKGKNVFVPKIVENEMKSIQIEENDSFTKKEWNIWEPNSMKSVHEKTIEVVLIPLLLCDYEGNRIGYGKGFYDIFLSKCSSTVIKIGVSFFEPLSEKIPTEKHDVPLHYLITPERIVSFSPKDSM